MTRRAITRVTKIVQENDKKLARLLEQAIYSVQFGPRRHCGCCETSKEVNAILANLKDTVRYLRHAE